MNLIVTGSRGFNDYLTFRDYMDYMTQCYGGPPPLRIVRRIDEEITSLVTQYAEDRKIPVDTFESDYATYKKKAEMVRDMRIAENSDLLVFFSKDRQEDEGYLVKEMDRLKKPVSIYHYPESRVEWLHRPVKHYAISNW